MPSLIGKTLGKVHVDMFLAKGGMAEVYIGTHTTLHRSVAVKFLKADLQEEPELRDRFEREAQVIAMLRHPNIVQIFDFDSHLNQPYLVMEYVPGVSLGAYLRDLHSRLERLSLSQVLDLLKKIGSALTYAHENNVIHRDVKPANILLTSRSTPIALDKSLPLDTEPILTDFGLVRFLQSSKQTSTGVITGTPAYMSPEQARGEQTDGRTDVYSLGVTVYEMLAGHVPFEADSTLSVLHQHINNPYPPIEGISDSLQEVMNRALAKETKDRFQTPLEFADAFETALTQTADAETRLFGSAIAKSITVSRKNLETVATKQKRNIAAPIIVGMAGIILAIGAIFMARMPDNPALQATQPEAVSTDDGHNETPDVSAPVLTNGEDPVGVFRFQDGTGIADNITFSSLNLPLPPEGTHYEAWLIEDDGETRFSLGMIEFDEENRASLNYVDATGRNLIRFYHGVELTIEPSPDNSPNPSNDTAFLTILPAGGYTHVRHLLSSFPSTPNETPFIEGLNSETELLTVLADNMLTAFEANDEDAVRQLAEEMLTLIVGNQSTDYKDWNENGTVDDPSDGYGLLLNGTNTGYIQGAFTHADLSLTSPDATENMLIHGEHVKISATNVSEWTPLLRDQLIIILKAETLGDAQGAIRQAVVFADQIRNGVDTNGNENIEPISGEGGAVTAHDHSYYMADILIYP